MCEECEARILALETLVARSLVGKRLKVCGHSSWPRYEPGGIGLCVDENYGHVTVQMDDGRHLQVKLSAVEEIK